MFNSLKLMFWDYIIPKIDSQITKKQRQDLTLKKTRVFNQLQSVGNNCSLSGKNWKFSSPKKIIIGNNIHFDEGVIIEGSGGVTIGDHTHICENVSIYSSLPNFDGNALPHDQTKIYKPVHIGKNVWIGKKASILPGVQIGEGAIIGIGSIVNRNIEPYEVVGSPKTEHLKYRNINYYKALDKNLRYGGVNGQPLCENQIKKFRKSYEDNRDKEIVFILSTGRSGSNSIVDILNQHPACKAFHEDIRQLIRLSTKLAENPHHQSIFYDELKQIFSTKIWQASEEQVLVHSDQRLWNLIPFLSEYFPNAKFIHIKREKYSCIKSMYARGWYAKEEYPNLFIHDWAKYRLQGDKIGIVSSAKWREFSSLQKCTWYWYHINKTIEVELSKLDKNKKISINLEELKLLKNELALFIFDEPFDFKIVKSNQVRKSDINKYENIDNKNLKDIIDKTIFNL